jgi:GntR family transcriptional regulator
MEAEEGMQVTPRGPESATSRPDAAVSASRDLRKAIDRSSPEPVWQQVRADVVRRIQDGDFDEAVPGEHVMAAEYGVSRQTVRLALRSLRESGVVTAGRGHMSKVARSIDQPVGTLYSLFSSVEAAGMLQASRVRALDIRTDSAAAEHLQLPPSAELLYLERVRFADGDPMAIDQVWLPARVAAPLLEADFGHTALYREMADRLGLQPRGGREEIDAIVLTDQEAATLHVWSGAPGFAVRRLGCLNGQPIEWRHTVIRADRFRLLVTFTPDGTYRIVPSPAPRDDHAPTPAVITGQPRRSGRGPQSGGAH